ncbi:MAG: glycerophosphodiester phosphodiesterase family protein [Candidatus Acidiferrales bacterium]
MRPIWVIAHRGASGYAPENTLAAYQRALEVGAGFIETDLHLTRDARFVAMHDATLDRTTNGHGAVSEFSLAELRELDAGMWFDRSFMGQRIPTLEDILAFAQKQDAIFYLELKFDTGMGMDSSLAGALRGVDNASRTVVISFDPRQVENVRKFDPGIMTGLLVEKSGGDCVQLAVALGARQVCPRSDLITPELIAQAHAADLRVATWTVDDEQEMKRVIGAGADGVMTNFPDRLRALTFPL